LICKQILAEFEKNDVGCTLELGHSLDLVLTINTAPHAQAV